MSNTPVIKRRKHLPSDNSHDNHISLPDEFQNTSGKVIRVTLLNFLNHAHLSMTCSPNLNLIFGRNGQGKSAIVQGMALCFGGSGHSVGRNTNLGRYIKDYHMQNGPSFARVELYLSNHGADSFQPGTYGDVIILSRTIHKNSSSFSMGGILAKKANIDRRSLNQYLRHVKINIANPTTYMDQEMCKTFFFHSNSRNFYKYYSAAAGLDQMEERIEAEKNNLEVCKAELKIRKRVLLPDKEKLESLAKQISSFQQKLNEWKMAKQTYKLSLYRAEKESHQRAKDKYDKYIQSDPRKEIEKLRAENLALSNDNNNFKTEIQELVSDSAKLKDRIRVIFGTLSTCEESINEIKSSVTALQANISQTEAQLNKLDDDSSNLPEMGSEVERLEKDLEVYNSEYKETDRQYQLLMTELIAAEKLRNNIDLQLNEAKKELEDLKRENGFLLQTVNKKDRVQANVKSLYNYDPANVRESIKAMKSTTLFVHEPIGPIGEYLKVVPSVPCWKILPIIERHLKRILLVWLVATESDRRALGEILVSKGCDPSNVKIMKTNIFYDVCSISKVEHELSQSTFKSVLYNYLSIEDIPNVLLGVLVEMFNISKTAICKDGDEMFNVLKDERLNITAAYTLDKIDFGKRVNGSLFFSPSDDKNPHMYRFVRYAHGKSLDHVSEINDRIEQGKEREEYISKVIKGLSNKFKESQGRLVSLKTRMNKLKKDKTMILKRRTQAESDLNNVKMINEINEDITPTSKNSRLNKMHEQMKIYEDKLVGIVTDKEQHESTIKQLQMEFNTLMKSISDKKLSFQGKQGQINNNKIRIRQLERSIRAYNSTLDDYLRDVNESMRLINKYEEEFKQDDIKYTGELPDKSPEEYLKIVNMNRETLSKVADVSRGIESHLENLKEKYKMAEESLKDREQKLIETQNNYTNQKQNYNNRCKRFDDYRTRMETLAKKEFKRTLSAVCGYDGNLIFNDINRTLDIHIHNKQQSYEKAHVARDLKTLSGGEQSSIQLSMIHSLASISFSPVHMFDEIDVYMDENTRIKNINAIVNFAEKNRNRQLFLLTPHIEFAKHISEKYPEITKLFNVSKDTN